MHYNDAFLIDGFIPAPFVSVTLLSRTSEQNFAISDYEFQLQLSVNSLINGSVLKIVLPI